MLGHCGFSIVIDLQMLDTPERWLRHNGIGPGPDDTGFLRGYVEYFHVFHRQMPHKTDLREYLLALPGIMSVCHICE
jgi:hypothetical protein